jgi:hypothetical protein
MGQGGKMAIKNLLAKKVKVCDMELRLWVFVAFLILAAFIVFCLVSEVVYAVNHGKTSALPIAFGGAALAWLAIYIIFFAIQGRTVRSFLREKI